MTHFIKMHGLGNDFLVLDAREQPIVLSDAQVRALANRHTGIGFDQLILIEPSASADVRLRFWNSDGGEVAACGNGSRAADGRRLRCVRPLLPLPASASDPGQGGDEIRMQHLS